MLPECVAFFGRQRLFTLHLPSASRNRVFMSSQSALCLAFDGNEFTIRLSNSD
jgi:hypothetical protein